MSSKSPEHQLSIVTFCCMFLPWLICDLARELQRYTMKILQAGDSSRLPPLSSPVGSHNPGSPEISGSLQSPLANIGRKRQRLFLPERNVISPGHCAKMTQIFDEARRSLELGDQVPRTPNIRRPRLPLSESQARMTKELVLPKSSSTPYHTIPSRLPRFMKTNNHNDSPNSSPSRCLPPRSRRPKNLPREPLSSGFSTPIYGHELADRGTSHEESGRASFRHYVETMISPQQKAPPNTPSFSPESFQDDYRNESDSSSPSPSEYHKIQPLVVRRIRPRSGSNKENQPPQSLIEEPSTNDLYINVNRDDKLEDQLPASGITKSPTVLRHKIRSPYQKYWSPRKLEDSLAKLSPDVDRYRKRNRPRRERCPSYYDKDILGMQSLLDEEMLDA
jgi:hypothetical protein